MLRDDETFSTSSVGLEYHQKPPEICSFCAPNRGYIVVKKKLENGLEVEETQKCPACSH